MSAPRPRLAALLACAALLAGRGGLARAQASGSETAVVREGGSEAAGVVLGRVCVDQDGDGVCQPAEPGVAQAQIILSDGKFAITDAEGRYHIAAVPSRRIERGTADHGPRDQYGRVLVKLDLGSIGRGASVKRGPRRVVEIGPAAAEQVDFPVTFAKGAPRAIAPATPTGPVGEIRGDVYRYQAAGRTTPGHRVEVDGVASQVGADGIFSASVPLRPGPNQIVISDLAPEGDLVVYLQQVAVVLRKKGGALFVPQPPQRIATLGLPDTQSAPAKDVDVAVQAPPGTEVRLGGSLAQVGADGRARLALSLVRGENKVPLQMTFPGEAGAQAPSLARTITIRARGLSYVSALGSFELGYDLTHRELAFFGRGMASGQLALGELDLAGGIDLDSGDVLRVVGRARNLGFDPNEPPSARNPRYLDADPGLLWRPREPYSVERVIDPQLYPPVFGDDGLAGSFNPSDARFWLHLKHPRFGSARFGAFHADLGGVEVGRYRRSLFGGAVDARAPLGPVTARVQGFGAPPFSTEALVGQPVPAHDELWGTGGSLYFLRNPLVVPGSEKLAIELRDGITGLPLEERALERHRDYDIDYATGRILLARPLPMSTGEGPLLTTPLQSRRPALVADYEHASATGQRDRVLGGRASVSLLDYVEVAATGVKESRFGLAEGLEEARDYRLLGVSGKAQLGPVTLSAEGAQSLGTYLAPAVAAPGLYLGRYGFSDTGGLSYLASRWSPSAPVAAGGPAWAWAGRAAVSTEAVGAQAWVRGHDAGYSDAAVGTQAQARQFGASGRLTLGRFELSALYDDRVGADPRDPFGPGKASARDATLRATGRFGGLSVTAEGSYASLEMPHAIGDAQDLDSGWRAGAGLRLDYQIVPGLSVNASHHHRVAGGGEGPGSLDDTFSAVGASWRPENDLGFSVRGGWGPGVGTQVQFAAERAGEGDLAYGAWTADVDGPNAGQTVMTSGARRRVDESTDAFVEDLFARDIDSMRVGRAVGLDIAPARRLGFSARYERGVRLPFTGEPGLLRDAGSGKVSWLVAGLRLSALAEVRHERGRAIADDMPVERWQTLGALMVDARPFRWLTLGGRLIATNTRNHGATEAQSVEGYAAAALRLEPWAVVASYSLINRIPGAAAIVGVPLDSATAIVEPRLLVHLVSLRPTVVLFDRLRIGAGAHAGFFRAGASLNVYSVSLRPAVRLVGGLEVAAEAARRSVAPQNDTLDAVRVEVAYWFEGVLGIAVGYNLHGFTGTGIEDPSRTGEQTSQRVYVRVEAAY